MKKIALISTAVAALMAAPVAAQQMTTDQQTLVQERGGVEQGAPLYVSPTVVRTIKQALNQHGYNVGSMDGSWDARTRDAVANFQQANGLEPTGNLNLRLLSALGIGIGGGGTQGVQAYSGGPPPIGQPWSPSAQGLPGGQQQGFIQQGQGGQPPQGFPQPQGFSQQPMQ